MGDFTRMGEEDVVPSPRYHDCARTLHPLRISDSSAQSRIRAVLEPGLDTSNGLDFVRERGPARQDARAQASRSISNLPKKWIAASSFDPVG